MVKGCQVPADGEHDRRLIRFGAVDERTFADAPPPIPASSRIPQWYLNSSVSGWEDRGSFPTVKRCVPVRDSMTAGYLLRLPYDVHFSRQAGGRLLIQSSPRTSLSPVGKFPKEQMSLLPVPAGFDSTCVYKWINPWTIHTPPGFSVEISHPKARGIHEFMTLGAVVDTDVWKSAVNLAFLLAEGFEGVLSRGTPIAQVFPFRRESWEHEIFQEDRETLLIENQRFWKSWGAGYRDRYRQPKKFR